jgi:transposase
MVFVAYGTQLHLIVHHMRVNLALSDDEIRRVTGFDVSSRTMDRWIADYEDRRVFVTDLAGRKTPGLRRVLTDEDDKLLRALIAEDCTLFYRELRELLYQRQGTWVSVSTICREVRDRLGITVKVATRVHAKLDPEQVAAWVVQMSTIPASCVVVTDESACRAKTLARKMGRAARGERAERTVATLANEHWSVCPAITINGLLAFHALRDGFTRADFESFLEFDLVRACALRT